MSGGEVPTPLDEWSGIPLPLAPADHADNIRKTNWHHPWHERSAPELTTLGGQALRGSRLQLVDIRLHNRGKKHQGRPAYHDVYSGPPLPTTDEECFRKSVPALAGFVPDRAIDLSTGEPKVIDLSAQQMEWLSAPPSTRPIPKYESSRVINQARWAYNNALQTKDVTEAEYVAQAVAKYTEQASRFGLHHFICEYRYVRRFFWSHLLNQDLSHVQPELDAFREARSNRAKVKYGELLLKEAAYVATLPVRPTYETMHSCGRLHPAMPACVVQFAIDKLGTQQQRARYLTNSTFTGTSESTYRTKSLATSAA